MDYSMEVSALGDRISIGEEAHVITLGVSTGFPAGSTAGLAYTLSPLQARVFGAQMRAAADAAEGHPGMPSDEEVNAAAKVFCGGVWNGFDPATMMPTERFDRFWGDGEGHQLYLAIARHALIAARMQIIKQSNLIACRQSDMQAIKQANNQENKQSNNQERSRTMNDNHNEDEAPFDGTSEDSTLEDQMSAHIAAIAASGVAAEAEALANRQADMAARERRETRLAILAAIAIIGAFAICVIKTLKKYT